MTVNYLIQSERMPSEDISLIELLLIYYAPIDLIDQ